LWAVIAWGCAESATPVIGRTCPWEYERGIKKEILRDTHGAVEEERVDWDIDRYLSVTDEGGGRRRMEIVL
jgi:hypothetical protein